jgi:hypothetical protein
MRRAEVRFVRGPSCANDECIPAVSLVTYWYPDAEQMASTDEGHFFERQRLGECMIDFTCAVYGSVNC